MSEVWLITGAAGFIGSNLAEHLLSHGHEVFGLDDLSSGSLKNIASFQSNPHWHWIQGDINGPELEEIFNQNKITHVCHLAALVSVATCEEEPAKARLINEHGFERVLMYSLDYGVKQFIYASSSAVYGDSETLPLREDQRVNPIGVYGETKVNNELAAARLCESTEMSCVGFRFFNLFGPRQTPFSPYAAVIPKWVHALKKGEAPVIFGDGSATRDFCSIQNIIIALDCARQVCPQGHQVFNIGTGKAVTLNLLYDLICRTYGIQHSPQYLPWIHGHILHSSADVSLAKRILGYYPKVSLEEGLSYLKLDDF